MDLQTAWFLLFGVLLTGYAVLDGFDLGVGVLSLFARGDTEKRLHLNAIGPVWDGNEVWLLTAAGSLFAAFPPVYATVFSGFYVAFMVLLAALVARAVSFEFRSKVEAPAWRRTWDLVFGLGSLLPALLYGIAVGNVLRGIPLDDRGEFAGTFLGLLHPFPLLVGLLTLAMFVTHGALWMAGKTGEDLRARMIRTAGRACWVWAGGFGITSLAAASWSPVFAPGRPLVWLALLLVAGGLIGVPTLLRRGSLRGAFLASSVAVAGHVGLVGASLYPRLVPAIGDLSRSLTIHNASSTPRTLGVMLVVALVGMPVVIAYTAFVYRVFKGRVTLDEHSY
ncbi:MAG: cytochrome d ubiquinol oxidase subunit II [Deltaproteobacteria bacterium]|nr:cytochrome d ubiquinol oxidase subunit II [Deltaproteobacteria bacterium]